MAIYRFKVFETLFEDPHPWMTIPTRRVGGGGSRGSNEHPLQVNDGG